MGRLVLVSPGPKQGLANTWNCDCDCGRTAVRHVGYLNQSNLPACVACGYERRGHGRLTHGGKSRHNPKRDVRLYTTWQGMRDRCNNPNNSEWHCYGGKGIRLCAEWHDFGAFRTWAMANGYGPTLTIERKKTSLDYSPDNCEWLSRSENSKRMWEAKPKAQRAIEAKERQAGVYRRIGEMAVSEYRASQLGLSEHFPIEMLFGAA